MDSNDHLFKKNCHPAALNELACNFGVTVIVLFIVMVIVIVIWFMIVYDSSGGAV